MGREKVLTSLEIEQIPVLSNNYVYLLHDSGCGATAAVDPAVDGPVSDVLAARNWHLSHILATHHHTDHIGGIQALKAATGCQVVAARGDGGRIPDIDVLLGGGDSIAVGTAVAQIIAVPGHTSEHLAYWFPDSQALFCGDALFSIGCGRVFEGTPEQMWNSLCKLRSLPDETRVYCAHEYTLANVKFALTIDPDNEALRRRFEIVESLRARGLSTIPSTMAEEKAANPFLRADVAELQQAVGMLGADPVAVFAAIRRRKDEF